MGGIGKQDLCKREGQPGLGSDLKDRKGYTETLSQNTKSWVWQHTLILALGKLSEGLVYSELKLGVATHSVNSSTWEIKVSVWVEASQFYQVPLQIGLLIEKKNLKKKIEKG